MSNAALHRVQRLDRRPPPRILFAIAVAWLFPSLTLFIGFFTAILMSEERPFMDLGLIQDLLLLAPVYGLVIGWPTFLVGALGWRLLHQRQQRSFRAAALLGFVAPLGNFSVVALLHGPESFYGKAGLAIVAGMEVIGIATGLLVRWIAYGSADPRHP